MQLTIEKLVYGGDGLARLTEPGEPRAKTVFVPFVLPGEQVEARAIEEKPGFVRAALEKVLIPSAQRIAPHCPYFERCGGCHYQHTDYTHQLALKREILRETLERTAKIKWQGEIHLHPSPPWGYRNRTRMKVGSAPFALGYYRHNSHDLLPVESCPISSPLINRAIAVFWQMGREGGFADHPISEVEFFADHADAKLLLELYASKSRPKADWEKLAQELRASLPELISAYVFSKASASTKASRKLKTQTAEIQVPEMQIDACFQEDAFLYKSAATNYRVSPGSFFQTNRLLTERLIEIVCAGMQGKLAFDLYAGVGLFSVPLAKTFESVEAVEVEPSAFHDLRYNVPPNVRLHRMTTAAYLKTATVAKAPELVVVDPPRAGLGNEVARKLASLAAACVTYVSCDPATLARDLTIFLQSGYRLEQVHLVDLFPQTYHIESVMRLARK